MSGGSDGLALMMQNHPKQIRTIANAVIANRWMRFLAARVVRLIVVLIALVFLTFSLVRLVPGDPVLNVTGLHASASTKSHVRHELGLDRSLPQQFVAYVAGLAKGDLGVSFQFGQPVAQLILERSGPSLQLGSVALLLLLVCGVPGGMLAGVFTRNRRHTTADVILTASTSIVGSLPEYVTATLLAFVFAVLLRVLPVAGTEGPQSLVLPGFAIGLRPIAVLARIVRVEMLNVLEQDFMRTARSKRLPGHLLYFRHALPNVITAALSISGVLFAGLVGGAILVEYVFRRVGLGTSLTSSVLASDYPVVQGIVLV